MNPAPSLQGALWSGNQQLATKKQLLSSISGLYTDIQDINISTINVTTLGASTFNGSFVSLSTLQLKALDIGGLNFSFDLGLGDALGGALAGLGAAVGGAFVGVGTGVGLAVQGLETGLATLINGRGENFINNSYFETVNGTTQLQISTLGNAFPLYSSIQRVVSSISPNTVPGEQIFVSSFFLPGTTCIRSVSDPLSIISGNSNIASSTIQSFGQWTPFIDPTVAGEDITARNASFSTLTVSLSNDNPLMAQFAVAQISNAYNYSNTFTLYCETTTNQITSNVNAPLSQLAISQLDDKITFVDYAAFPMNVSFISTPYTQYTSTIGTYGTSVFFIKSTITSQLSTIPLFIYTGTDFGGGNFAVAEPDETGFLSTGTMDLVAQSSNITFQWGLAVNNLNSTIAQGTSKRVSWDIPNNTSNFINIPVPQSTIIGGRSNALAIRQYPNQTEIFVQNQTPFQPNNYNPLAFNITGAVFGSNNAWNNQPGYAYQFNDNVFINGTIEADTFIAISSIINVSTNIQTFFSTQTFDADEATISSLTVTSLVTTPNMIASNVYISSLQTYAIGADNISSFGIEVNTALSQFSYVSTLGIDFQILETGANVTTNLNNIVGNAGSRIQMNRGTFNVVSTNTLSTATLFANNPTFSTINLSTVQELGLTSLINYPGAITSLNTASGTTAPVVGIGFKAQIQPDVFNQTRVDYNWDRITGTSNGLTFQPLAIYDILQPTLQWNIQNVNTINTSTINVNTISTTSHSGNDITANTITVLSNLSFPIVQCNATPLVMTLSNTNTSNFFTSLQTNIVQGAAFPQQSNQFSITHTGSNTTISDKEGLVFNVTTGDTITFGSGVETLTVVDGDIEARSIRYGTNVGGFLQPRAFTMIKTISFGAGQSTDDYFEIMDSGSNTFLAANYNFLPAIQGFYVDNSAVAFNEVVIAPLTSNNNWWVQITTRLNAGAAGADGTIAWNCLLFPYDMMT